ncbi:MAG: MBL fold metallo-hydrolase, partial [Victivallales bacterium]|nr:MBL fold metallo-hydrolase [Victivallales bacterium]
MFETDSAYIGVTVLGSGSSGNATIVHCGGEGILIDAGFSFREFKRRFEDSGLANAIRLRAILVTHEHDDHVKGLRVCADNLELPVFTTRKCADVLRRR